MLTSQKSEILLGIATMAASPPGMQRRGKTGVYFFKLWDI
jgi:hypothetical protein